MEICVYEDVLYVHLTASAAGVISQRYRASHVDRLATVGELVMVLKNGQQFETKFS